MAESNEAARRRARRTLAQVERQRARTPGRVEELRARAARSKRPRALSLDAIVGQALRIVDAEGVDAVSMRRVAAEFDTGPASLYAYVANKDELLRLVLGRVIDAVELPADEADWQQVVRTWAHNARDEFLRHNDLARLTFAHIPTGPKMLEAAELVLGAMIRGGVPAQVAAWAMDITSLYVAADAYEGWLLAQRFADDSGRDPEEVGREHFERQLQDFAEAPPGRYPYVTGNLAALMVGGSDERFSFAIDMLIAGFASRIPSGEAHD
ncbi:MAG TPA: TetR/AcrR family transcriptional regulator C-terminal domain-containing protein [Marmoricola sp.]|nr:TetR/AcrR family transcriptional regulator C-terminal domain-containing protein [Marmoricola sp.]